jgi:hypothetical protein
VKNPDAKPGVETTKTPPFMWRIHVFQSRGRLSGHPTNSVLADPRVPISLFRNRATAAQKLQDVATQGHR